MKKAAETATAKRATISFSERDIKSLIFIQQELDLPSVNHAISVAIKIAENIIVQAKKGDVVFRSGTEERSLFIPGLEKRSEELVSS